jgi:hypothetical protein
LTDLPNIKSFEAWEPSVEHGYKAALQDKIEQAEGVVRAVIDSVLTSEVAREIAVMLLQRSSALGMDLINLISNQRHELVVKGKMDEDKAWELTAKMVRAFWAEIYKVRAPAAQACLPAAVKGSSKDAAKVLYCTLQAHRIMQEFKSKEFIRHPSMATVLMLHQVRAGVTREELVGITKKFKEDQDKQDVAVKGHIDRLNHRITSMSKGKKVKEDE